MDYYWLQEALFDHIYQAGAQKYLRKTQAQQSLVLFMENLKLDPVFVKKECETSSYEVSPVEMQPRDACAIQRSERE